MIYKIKDFNISVSFNFPGEYTGNETIYDRELKKVFLFNYITQEENISASWIQIQQGIDLTAYVKANLNNFLRIKGKVILTKKEDDKVFALIELQYDKIIQIYFIRNGILYCFSATIPRSRNISLYNITENTTSKKMLYVISSIKDRKKLFDF